MLVRSVLILLLVASTAAPAVAATYDVDAVHSSVNFRIRHMRVSLALPVHSATQRADFRIPLSSHGPIASHVSP